jgi:phenylacetate-CoA ligase
MDLFSNAPSGEWETDQFSEALPAVARRAASTTAYANLPMLTTPSMLKKWPITEKGVVKLHPEHYRTDARVDVRIASSGSTGAPMPWYRTWSETISNAGAVAERWKSLLGYGVAVASVLDHNTAAAGQLLELTAQINGWPLARLFPYRIGGPRFDYLAEAFIEFRPTALVATPSGVIDIEDAWRSSGHFDEAVKSVSSLLLIGAPATPGMQSRLARSWGAKAYVASYGSTELGTIACGCDLGRLHIIDGRFHLELRVDGVTSVVEAGNTGELIVTPLFSEATQLVRYATGDTVSAIGCACGTSGGAITIGGRSDDVVLIHGVPFGPEPIEDAILGRGGAGDYLLEVDEAERLIGVQVLPLGDVSIDLHAISVDLQAPVRLVNRLPSLVRAGGAVKSWRRTRTVKIYGNGR